jgi:hypothetical protein
MFIAALFTIATAWNQPRCPTTDDQIKKIWCIHIWQSPGLASASKASFTPHHTDL